jgi:hypothetical protein
MRVSENQEVADLLDYNSGNIEIANIYRTLFRRDPSNTKTKEHISVSIIEKCKLLLKNELSTDDFEIERGCGNERLDLRIPEEFICLMKEIRKQTFKDKDTSRIIRISLITGMYLFCNIIISGSVELLDIEIGRVLDGLMKLHIKYSSKNTYD